MLFLHSFIVKFMSERKVCANWPSMPIDFHELVRNKLYAMGINRTALELRSELSLKVKR